MDQAEKLRNVIKLKNQKLPQKARVITVTSGKGGVGKSSITVNLAIQFQKMNKKVIIFDADLGLANVEVMLGAIPKHNLSDVIYRGMDIRQIITEGPAGVSFISGGSGIVGMNNLSKDQITFLVRNLPKNLHGWQPHESAFRFWQNSDSGAVPLTENRNRSVSLVPVLIPEGPPDKP